MTTSESSARKRSRPTIPLGAAPVFGLVLASWLGVASLAWGAEALLGLTPMPRGGYPVAMRDTLWPAVAYGIAVPTLAVFACRRRHPGLALLTALLLPLNVVQILVTGGSLGLPLMALITSVPTLGFLAAAATWCLARRRERSRAQAQRSSTVYGEPSGAQNAPST
jgi:hypothetical protein